MRAQQDGSDETKQPREARPNSGTAVSSLFSKLRIPGSRPNPKYTLAIAFYRNDPYSFVLHQRSVRFDNLWQLPCIAQLADSDGGLPRPISVSSFSVGLGDRLPFVLPFLEGGFGNKVSLCATEFEICLVDLMWCCYFWSRLFATHTSALNRASTLHGYDVYCVRRQEGLA
jgi:hypothetical protein